jgi:arylsulfatase A-like enzyme
VQPNIILINCDDLGYGDLGCYGSEVNETPVLDRMADEGMRFTDFYMASPWCSPSRAAMLTGCYPQRIGFGAFDGRVVLFPGQPIGLSTQEITIARLLQDAGYATKIIGKWHCGDQQEFLPTKHGFDSYYGLPYSNDMGVQFEDDIYPPLPLLRDEEVIQQQPDQTGLTERYVEEAVRFIRENKDRPFFLYLAHMYVHLPVYVPDRFLRESGNGAYGGAVACIDWAAGVIFHELKAQGMDENTLVIFTSDNGSRAAGEGGSNAPLRGTKRTTWEGGMRLPCIMRWPAGIPAGSVCSEVATSMDLYPTLATLAGAPVPADRTIDGRDIRSLMFAEEGAESPHDAFFYYRGNDLEAVRSGRWKLHVRKGDVADATLNGSVNELYDLESDVGETDNVYADHPDVVRELAAKLESCRRDIGDAATGTQGEDVRPIGRVENPDTLTHYDPEHPYIVAMYDLKDRG